MSIAATAAAGISTGTAPAVAPKQNMDSEVFMKLWWRSCATRTRVRRWIRTR